MSFDIIGDVHGEYDKLVGLLQKLGYRKPNGAWRLAGHTAIFVGDLIDRGRNQVETVDLVRKMVETGSAKVVMGNHEFNAIAWATPDPEQDGEYLRPHSQKNRNQHERFLHEISEDSGKHRDYIAWFKTLPLWLDMGGIRVIHACWNDECIDYLCQLMPDEHTLTDELIVRSNRKGDPVLAAVETLCKGIEQKLPEGTVFQDEDGHVRDAIRIRWWQPEDTYRKAALVSELGLEAIPNIPKLPDDRVSVYDGKTVFFGHYWLSESQIDVFSPIVACVDYSAVKGGPLVAYRWEGEPMLSQEHFVRYG